MLRGDLATGPLGDVLAQLGGEAATGCLHVRSDTGEDARIYLKEGRVYAAVAPGPRPLLGVRLVSSGALATESLEEALEAQASELHGWRLDELLVHLGYVTEQTAAEFGSEQVLDAVTELGRWTTGAWRFRRAERTREASHLAFGVPELLQLMGRREQEWARLLEAVHARDAVPGRCAAPAGAESVGAESVGADAQTLLGKIDGERTVEELAFDCGFTVLEGARVLAELVEAGLAQVAPPARTLPPPPDPAPTDLAAGLSLDRRPACSPDPVRAEAAGGARSATALATAGGQLDDVDRSLARVSRALSAVMGPQGLGEAPQRLSRHFGGRPVKKNRLPPIDEAELARRERIRAAAAAELATAHADAEAVKAETWPTEPSGPGPTSLPRASLAAIAVPADRVADIVDLASARTGRRHRDEQHPEAAALEKRAAEAAETERLHAEAEAETARLEAEVTAAAAAEAARLQAEAEAEAETARLQAEVEAETERLEAEAAAAEAEAAETARLEAETAEAVAVLVAEREAHREFEQARLAAEAELADLARGPDAPHHQSYGWLTEETDELGFETPGRPEEAPDASWTELPDSDSAADDSAADVDGHPPVDAEQQAAVHAALAEVAATVGTPELTEAAPDDPAEPDEPEEVDPLPAAIPEAPRSAAREATDTASLLRELSSLGLDEPSDPPPVPRQASAPRSLAYDRKPKRRGLFGR